MSGHQTFSFFFCFFFFFEIIFLFSSSLPLPFFFLPLPIQFSALIFFFAFTEKWRREKKSKYPGINWYILEVWDSYTFRNICYSSEHCWCQMQIEYITKEFSLREIHCISKVFLKGKMSFSLMLFKEGNFINPMLLLEEILVNKPASYSAWYYFLNKDFYLIMNVY